LADQKSSGSDRTVLDCLSEAAVLDGDFDFSTPEGEAAIRAAIALVLEVREAESGLAKKIRLYERTLGLAVIPVLLRRMILAVRYR
jgi:hypothetical protein